MPTSKLNLPTIDNTKTADIVRDMNALAEAVDAAAGTNGGLATLDSDGKVPSSQLNVSAPADASTTTKGIVMLEDSTTSTSVTKAATPKSVKDAKDGLSTQIGILSDNAVPYGIASGTDSKTITIANAFTTLKAGLALSFKNSTTNTTAVTLNVNELGAKPIVKSGGTALSSGNLKAGGVYTIRYDGTSFILQGEGGEYGAAQPSDVRAGTTFGTENGLRTGTMPPVTFATGTFILYENTAIKSSQSASSSNPMKIYDIDMTFPGVYRVSFNMNSGGYTGYGQIYKNGIPVGIQRSTTNSAGVEFTEDFSVNAGDNIQLYAWNSNSTAGTTFKLFRIAVQPLLTIVV